MRFRPTKFHPSWCKKAQNGALSTPRSAYLVLHDFMQDFVFAPNFTILFPYLSRHLLPLRVAHLVIHLTCSQLMPH